jgi:RHS repeat-associated protein
MPSPSKTLDNSGNMTGWDDKRNGQRRNILWNEENRVKEIQDNGKSSYYLYDDAGERVLKRGQHGETFYINRFFTIRNGELGTKSIYAGNTRLVSKLVKTPNTTTANTTVISTTSTVPGINGLANGQGKKLGIIKRLAPGTATIAILPPEEKDQFFYHGDHLGSSNMITDAKGAIYQHLEYFPYGETWIEEGGSYGGNTPGYKFTGKELDPETGLYYFGARYYEPVLSRWVSADPILGEYLDGNPNGGVFGPGNLSLYSYSLHNPVTLLDPDGRVVETPWDVFNVGLGVASLGYNIKESNWGWAAADAAGLAYDGVATAVPFLPAGASSALKAYKLGNSVKNSVTIGRDISTTAKYADKAVRAGKDLVGSAATIGTKIHKATGELLGEVAGKAEKLSEGAASFFNGANKATGKKPDLLWDGSGMWADLTTKGSWGKHVSKYSDDFGEGFSLLYERGKGIVNRIKLPQIGGTTATGAQVGATAAENARE